VYTLGQSFALDALETRGDGMAAIRFVLTQPSVVPYTHKGRQIRALKSPEEWTGQSFLESARSVPLTLEHPSALVTPANAHEVMRGLADSVPATVMDGKVYHAGTVTHQTALDALRTKQVRAVSAGTHVDWVENSGVWVADDGSSHPYDVIQKNPRLNHIALTATPRLRSARILSLDSDIAAVFVPDQDTMEELKELLAKFSLDSTAVAALTAIVSDRDAKLADLGRQIDGLRGERDGLKQKLDTAPSLDSLGDRVAQELQQVAAIATKVPGLSLDALAKAKTVTERYLMALDSLKVSVDPKATEDYLRGRFEGATAQPTTSPAVESPLGPKTVPHPNSARAGIMAQDAVPVPKPSIEERIKAAQARNVRLSRGEKI
jgi:hypothetical protein